MVPEQGSGAASRQRGHGGAPADCWSQPRAASLQRPSTERRIGTYTGNQSAAQRNETSTNLFFDERTTNHSGATTSIKTLRVHSFLNR